MLRYCYLCLLILSATTIACRHNVEHRPPTKALKENKPPQQDSLVVYQSDQLIVRKIAAHVYQHISFLATEDFGKVPCNGMLVVNERQAVVFDTPTTEDGSEELINFVQNNLNSSIVGMVPTHFHTDCVGGMQTFVMNSLPVYASNQTVRFLKQKGIETRAIEPFVDSLTLQVGNKKVYARYYGPGHTKDNLIGYFPFNEAIFGGCLIKALGAGKGNLEDANTHEWPKTVGRIKDKYVSARIVIPGHGAPGSTELLDYTIQLFALN